MAAETPPDQKSEEHSIKARKHELFAEEHSTAGVSPHKPAQVYLRETPAMPLSSGVKAVLWVVAVLVVLLFLAAILTRGSRPKRPGALAAEVHVELRCFYSQIRWSV